MSEENEAAVPRLTIGVPAEQAPGERRVAATPETATRLQKLGFDVHIEQGAGVKANFPDALYEAAGATIVSDVASLWAEADIIIKVDPPNEAESALLREGGTVVSMVRPAQNKEVVERLQARDATLIALDCVPRISRAQKMDVLSSMANIAGYRAVLEASHAYGGFFTGQITAAGKTPPARVLVIGAGVAGLAAIGTARGLGAQVRAFDVRESVEDQVKSLGGKFLKVSIDESGEGGGGYAKTMSPEFIAAEMDLFRKQCDEVDIIITTALIPGRPAPKLVLADMVERLKPGSVIVDMAAEAGGNCELTVPGESVVRHGVTIIGFTDLTSRLPTHASQFFASNLAHLLDEMGGGDHTVDMENEAVRGAVILLKGELTWPAPKVEPSPTAAKAPEPAPAPPPPPNRNDPARKAKSTSIAVAVGGAILLALGSVAPPEFLAHLTVFVLAVFVGWQLVWNVSPALHTPLMSVTNAVSGIILVGGLLQAGNANTSTVAAVLGAIAVLVATINIAGGFLVTHRMLAMFRGGR
ncbi:MAG: NAD(P) transhydrogenase subunit alpha [Bradymonadia bacterium]|jgi:NAD(P) transhydrogenase subunit alpha